MTHTPNGGDPRRPKDIWKEQDVQSQTFTPAMLAKSAARLDANIGRRNIIEYVAAGAVIAFCIVMAAMMVMDGISGLAGAMVLAGTMVLAAGSGVVIWQMHTRTGKPQASGGEAATLASMRSELVRQRDALRQVWVWYLLPFAPGLFLIYGADFFRPDGNVALSVGLLAGTLGLGVLIGWLNLRAARGMDAEIAKIDAERQD